MLSKMSDLEFAALILQSKLDKLQNPNTPIASKYRCAIRSIQFLNQIEKTRMKESWSIQFWDDEGRRLLPQEIKMCIRDRSTTVHGSGWDTISDQTGLLATIAQLTARVTALEQAAVNSIGG